MLLIKALAQLSTKVELGYFIAKQVIKINKLEIGQEEVELKSIIEKTKQTQAMDYLVCSCEVNEGFKKLVELKTTLIRKKNNGSKEKDTNIDNNYICDINKDFFRTITKDEVHRFSYISGDPNYIHKGDKPIVQAMLILLLLEDHLALEKKHMYNCEITYISPILAGSHIFLCWQDSKTLFGISDSKVCFKVIFK
ncbi:hypothetical protein HGI79_19680 [Clostridium sp. DJ247]|nr:hypothetical protein [Clostridium sp. DJ247]